MNFQNSYLSLGSSFYQQTLPIPVAAPHLLLWNASLASLLQLEDSVIDEHQKAQIFSGNQVEESSTPIALAYSGHQFGHFNPQLGDGRAHLLGELIDQNSQRVDVQLKGSGPTRFSRQGDGRCALKPALREFIMSEAMHALNVPTSRCLAVVATGETVYRETPQPGAIVTRVASSHLRVGTFQHFASRKDFDALEALLDFAIERHYPDIATLQTDRAGKASAFIEAVGERQITLICHWLRVGFIHGVMNTDNTAISGETIDFGPCAMMGDYHPGTVYSSIDSQGRYAFGNQINIAIWNMARLAESLLPFLDDEQQTAIAKAESVIKQLVADITLAYKSMLGNKLGFDFKDDNDWLLIETLLNQMQAQELDYTLTFAELTQFIETGEISSQLATSLKAWLPTWLQRLGIEETTTDSDISALIKKHKPLTDALANMQNANPLVIPRNHHVERILALYQEAMLTGEKQEEAADELSQFLQVLRSPYAITEHTTKYQDAAQDKDQGYRTFCGT
ncbi:protein adenylyltransferase SelO [Thalassotalea sp. PS06]|uniref:protein adenylyltransferase SelO n=1 Tax=Thalassotalea sp. PS06 TaxID=2594005 RepID=UPI0011638935|nr:YdiU family protein [Thalassotalea sp. PS06]QDP02630.1 YdiU family protein [Thalassotalea sp. PS06]